MHAFHLAHDDSIEQVGFDSSPLLHSKKESKIFICLKNYYVCYI